MRASLVYQIEKDGEILTEEVTYSSIDELITKLTIQIQETNEYLKLNKNI